MTEPEEQRDLKRKRVVQACETCRIMKSKCDGKTPCNRCEGYGYSCSYGISRKRRRRFDIDPQQFQAHDSTADTPNDTLCNLIHEYDNILHGVRSVLPELDRKSVDINLASIKARLETVLSQTRQSEALPTQSKETRHIKIARTPTHSQRYLGEVSDVRFFNLVRRVVLEDDRSDGADEFMHSYEQDDPLPPNIVREVSLELPSPEIAEKYMDIYFSTIHIAYPFIPKSTFIRMHNKVREFGVSEDVEISWVALLYVVFAIGAYYTSFPAKGLSTELLHERYFRRALALWTPEVIERSLNHVSFLLAQCFYLLTICNTDRCWTTLGLAVRIGQSIGLHVESEELKGTNVRALLKAETRRRLWYSIYVLDRLLALQLGRPPAINDDDCNVPLPSRIDDAKFDWDAETYPLDTEEVPSTGDYFLYVIEFSKIVGFVLRDVYCPRREKKDGLLTTRTLDMRLSEWKHSLPRPLRFHIGHTFEKSIIFKRQRNMLAIKFHHLRALIHRPYLCLPLLKGNHDNSISSVRGEELDELSQYEKICVVEAQETAHLLHNVVDEKDLVHDFPWWQMISCLICASSILLVASLFTGLNCIDGNLEAASLDEDAETCLKVFEALSANSGGARIARDMMQRLRDHCIRSNNSHAPPTPSYSRQADALQTSGSLEVAMMVHQGTANDYIDSCSEWGFLSSQGWPSEISDSMIWSAQFLDAFQNSLS